MFRLVEVRPTSTVRSSTGITSGSPDDGHGSVTSCEAYQSGSTQISATHSTCPGALVGVTGGAVTGGVLSCPDGGPAGPAGGGRPSWPVLAATTAATPGGGSSGRGSCPVVKS